MIQYSVIVPHFNDAERLFRLLKSIPIMRKDLEVIVVDDCSSDQSSLNLAREHYPNVRWLCTPHNAGAGVARNVGLNSANGNWLVFADSDDEFTIDAFDHFDNTICDDDELIYFLAEGVQEVDGSSSLSVENLNELVMTCTKVLTTHNFTELRLQHVVPWAKIYSHSFIKSIGVQFDTVRYGNDIAFNVLAAVKAEHVRVVPLRVYRYFKRSGSLTTDSNKNVFLLRFNQSLSLAKRLDELGLANVRPATGFMLRSLKYGPRVAFQVWLLAIQSPMKIEWYRLLQPSRWIRFWFSQRGAAREYARLAKDAEQHHPPKDR